LFTEKDAEGDDNDDEATASKAERRKLTKAEKREQKKKAEARNEIKVMTNICHGVFCVSCLIVCSCRLQNVPNERKNVRKWPPRTRMTIWRC
jgi:hypothetical protein